MLKPPKRTYSNRDLTISKKRQRERALFALFLELAPEFCGERLGKWDQPDDEKSFPDIEGTSISGRKIGVELAEWLNEEEMQAAIQKERTEEEFLGAIGDQGSNPTTYIRSVWLHPKLARISPSDRERLRDELLTCVLECDRRWPSERIWSRGHQLSGDELKPYPLLAKYLDAIKLWSAEHGDRVERRWIGFPVQCGSFGKETMLTPLRETVKDKVKHYGRTKFAHLALLVIYNRAWLYNSPAETPLHSFEDAVSELRQMLGDNLGPFDSVFLYIALQPGRVIRVC